MLKRCYLLVVLLIALSVGCGEEESEDFVWGNLKNLGSNINSTGKDEHVTFTKDGKTMYFASIRGGKDNYDVYSSQYRNGQWTKAVCLPPPINTDRDEFDPFVTLDGKRLFFASNRDNPGPYWDCEIYITEWDGEIWTEPRIYDSTFVTAGKPDWGAAFPGDLTTFFFSSGRPPAKPQGVQMFQSKWQGDRWSRPEPMPDPVNTGGWEATPYITPDGQTLYLNSGRGRSDKKDVDIWKFERIDGKWTNAELIDGLFRSNKHDYDPCISLDGMKFYFTSNRDGGFGDADIWLVEKVYRQPKKHAAFLKETLHLDFTHPVFSEVVSRLTYEDMSLEQKLESLFYFTRDSITFIPDASLYASEVLEKGKAICYTKAMVYVSFCRLLDVPANVAKAEFVFSDKPKPHLHGIAKIYYKGRWLYIDTVSNRESWGYWDKDKARGFQAPLFSLERNIVVGQPFLKEVILGGYETNDVPEKWLDELKAFLETGSW
jgi:transglutaminase-like putative cysteine protease